MARLNIAPTRSNQIALKRDLAMATEGFNLLEQKREILVMELMRLVDRVRELQKEVDRRRGQAYDTLRKAVARNGYHHMRNVGAGVQYEHRVTTGTHVTAGVRVPAIKAEHGKLSTQFGFATTDSLVDQTMRDFLALLEVVGQLAEIETAIWLLARELKKTQRRVNALEQIFIPDFSETLRHIGESLESKDLESFFLRKMVKRNKQEKG